MSSHVGQALNPPERCAECGFDAATVTPANAEDTVRALGARYRAPLTRFLPGEDSDDLLRRRPAPDVWSALEYAAHVRDLIAMWGHTLHRALAEEQPDLPRLDPDIADRFSADHAYNSQDPATVAQELAANAQRMAAKVATIAPDQWDRSVIIGGEEMTVLAIVRKVDHEGGHHLLDVGRSLRAARTTR
ncbi:MAG: DinB family protein [Acidimicrobiales bacterium]